MDTLFLGSTCGSGSYATKITWDVVRREGHCCSWKMVIQPDRLFGVIGPHDLIGSSALGVSQRHPGEVELLPAVWDFAALVIPLFFCLSRQSGQWQS